MQIFGLLASSLRLRPSLKSKSVFEKGQAPLTARHFFGEI